MSGVLRSAISGYSALLGTLALIFLLVLLLGGCIAHPRAARIPPVPISPGSGEDLRGTGPITTRAAVIGSRMIPLYDEGDENDRTRLQVFAHLRLEPNLIIGLDGTPLDEDVGVMVAYRWIEEQDLIPSITFGSGADRIGTGKGKRSYSLTAAKQIFDRIDLYGSVGYGQDGGRWLLPFGIAYRPIDALAFTARYDGVHLHPGVDCSFHRYTFGVLWVEQKEIGVTFSVGFAF